MNKHKFNKINFRHSENLDLTNHPPTEIFCKQRFHNYYLRGQLIEISTNIDDATMPLACLTAHYHLKIFVLVKDDYFKRSPYTNPNREIHNPDYPRLGVFIGRSIAEFQKLERKQILNSAEETAWQAYDEKLDKNKILALVLKRSNKPVEINLRKFPIKETPYLIDSIRNNKDAILLKLELCLDRVTRQEKTYVRRNFPKRIFPLITYHLFENSNHYDANIAKCFKSLSDVLSHDLNCVLPDSREYHAILTKISSLGREFLGGITLLPEYISKLNEFRLNMKDRSSPLYDFCYMFFDDLLDELKEKQLITQCAYCNNIFPFHRTRKYCLLQTEGKKCGKAAQNRRSYARNQEKRRQKSKISIRETRAYYKRKGVKK